MLRYAMLLVLIFGTGITRGQYYWILDALNSIIVTLLYIVNISTMPTVLLWGVRPWPA